ncbi:MULTISPECIES: hypothetical protein [Vibrio]|jgi:hypothetical protein|uniref:hypothetical protein n=1 Tax=Vibrio TaxID=662 RepID=UPI00031F6D2C|nr:MULTISPECIES: hypothetical protein [Vibrio]MEC7309587.1 hypothetical protein [Vibrio crassostreae]OEF63110.1 hypothetical protein A152_22190 [Vibrio tasmaniensis 1F-187]OEF82101.1 hypothetical protein A162_01695 [Vibrio tasmaniensis 1F-155]PMO79905.1 hypothetical protein BCT01_09840 [Vibrio tasmaniensis]
MDTQSNKTNVDIDLSWTQLHQYSDELLLGSPASMIEDGTAILTLLQDYLLHVHAANQLQHTPIEGLTGCLQVAEGLIRMGNEIRCYQDRTGEVRDEKATS